MSPTAACACTRSPAKHAEAAAPRNGPAAHGMWSRVVSARAAVRFSGGFGTIACSGYVRARSIGKVDVGGASGHVDRGVQRTFEDMGRERSCSGPGRSQRLDLPSLERRTPGNQRAPTHCWACSRRRPSPRLSRLSAERRTADRPTDALRRPIRASGVALRIVSMPNDDRTATRTSPDRTDGDVLAQRGPARDRQEARAQ
jgi:hypothetical protein